MTDRASILLAAGSSSRLGQPKQMLRVGGETLLHRTARLASEAGCSPNIVVLGAYADLLRPQLLDLPAHIIVNENWQQGMGSSLSVGMTLLHQKEIQPKSVLMLVCDQPAVDAQVLRLLISELASSGKSIAASRYNDVLGVPAIFASGLFPELAALTGDKGARHLLARHEGDIAIVDFPAGAFDIDTAADALRHGAKD